METKKTKKKTTVHRVSAVRYKDQNESKTRLPKFNISHDGTVETSEKGIDQLMKVLNTKCDNSVTVGCPTTPVLDNTFDTSTEKDKQQGLTQEVHIDNVLNPDNQSECSVTKTRVFKEPHTQSRPRPKPADKRLQHNSARNQQEILHKPTEVECSKPTGTSTHDKQDKEDNCGKWGTRTDMLDSLRSTDSGIGSISDTPDLMLVRKSLCSSIEDLHEELEDNEVATDKSGHILHSYLKSGDGTLEDFCEREHQVPARQVFPSPYIQMDSTKKNVRLHKGYVLPDVKPRPSVMDRFKNNLGFKNSDRGKKSELQLKFDDMQSKSTTSPLEYHSNQDDVDSGDWYYNSDFGSPVGDAERKEDVIYDEVAIGFEASVPEMMRRESEKEGENIWSDDGVRYEEDDDDWYDWSDFDDSDSDDGSDVLQNVVQSDSPRSGKKKDKLFCIAEEILTTEETYVCKLELLVEAKNKVECLVKDSSFFPFIDTILKLHKDDLLPQLRDRIENWKYENKIGDIMKKFSPFLKLYTDYVKNFNFASKQVHAWMEKSSDVSKAVKSICEEFAAKHDWATSKLDIKAYMLEPVQRVPRYKLLLIDYMKHLPDDCEAEERSNIEDAVKFVSKAAEHFEFTINQTSEFGDLMMLDKQIDGPESIICSTRKLIKRGNMKKYCFRTDKIDQRHLFLFSDIFLVCKETKMPGTVKYKTRQCFHTEGMQILEGSKMDTELTFLVKTKQKTIEFLANTEDEKIEWQQVLWKVVGEKVKAKLNKKNRYSTRTIKSAVTKITELQENRLGKVAPTWVKNKDVTMCMICATDFTHFFRRHHCRACGNVLCSKCSNHSMALEYDDFREAHRVCDECIVVLTEKIPVSRKSNRLTKRSRELCIMSGFLHFSTNDRKSWQRRFCEIHEGGYFCTYKAMQDLKPFSLDDLGCCEMATDIHNQKSVIILKTAKEEYMMRDDDSNPEELFKWYESFEKAIKEAMDTRFIRNPSIHKNPDTVDQQCGEINTDTSEELLALRKSAAHSNIYENIESQPIHDHISGQHTLDTMTGTTNKTCDTVNTEHSAYCRQNDSRGVSGASSADDTDCEHEQLQDSMAIVVCESEA